MRPVDLHLHTRYSDGTWTPAELCAAAHRLNLAAIAVADHDTLDAIPEFLAAAAATGLEAIPAVEITCRVETTEIHLLGYLPDERWQNPELQTALARSKRIREQRVEAMIEQLNQLGIAVTTADVWAGSDCGTIGRPHVAQALVKRGVVRTVDEAFERFLRRGKPGYVERPRMPAAEAIGLVKAAGGVAVLAHPALNRVDDALPELTAAGLDGLEIWHSRHTPAQTERYRRLADALGLIGTGGSDCHGTGRGRPLLGTVPVPYECVTAIRKRAT
jgi:hypothetical protein